MSFSEFWSLYPRKVARLNAEKAWTKAKGDQIGEKIISGLKRQLPGWTDPKFIPHPASWLNAGRWDDQLHVDVRPGTSRPPDKPVSEGWGQPDAWKAMMNVWMFRLHWQKKDLTLDQLRAMAKERDRLAKQCLEMWGPVIPAERDIEVLGGMYDRLRAMA